MLKIIDNFQEKQKTEEKQKLSSLEEVSDNSEAYDASQDLKLFQPKKSSTEKKISEVIGARFIIEFWKEHQAISDGSLLNMGQWLSIPAILIGLIFIILSVTKLNNVNES